MRLELTRLIRSRDFKSLVSTYFTKMALKIPHKVGLTKLLVDNVHVVSFVQFLPLSEYQERLFAEDDNKMLIDVQSNLADARLKNI